EISPTARRHAALHGRKRRRWRGRRLRRRSARDVEPAVHRLPVRLAGVGVARLVPERDRERHLAYEVEVGAEVHSRVVVTSKMEVVQTRPIAHEHVVRARRDPRDLRPVRVRQADVEPVVRADGRDQLRIHARLGPSARHSERDDDQDEQRGETHGLTKAASTVIIQSTLSPERKSVPGIRFAVPADDALDRVAFAYSPLQEAVLSLHVLVAPKHHALQHEGVREMRRLPAGLKSPMRGFGFAYRGTMPGFVTASPEAEFSDFEQDLSELAGHEPQTLAFDFLRPLYDHPGRRDTALLADDAVRRHALGQCDRHGASPELVALIFDDPAELGRRFAALLTDSWDAAFSGEWSRLG